MSPVIRIPTPLREYVDGSTEIEVAADTVGDALTQLVQRSPRLPGPTLPSRGAAPTLLSAAPGTSARCSPPGRSHVRSLRPPQHDPGATPRWECRARDVESG